MEEAIKMLDKFITEHKFYNIKQSDGLEDNIEKVLNELESLQFKYRARAERLNTKIEKKDKIIGKMIDDIMAAKNLDELKIKYSVRCEK